MSWDVLYLNYHGNPPADIGASSGESGRDPLGPGDDVRAAVAQALPGVDWSDPAWGVYRGDGFTLEFNTGDDDPIESIMVHVRGGGDPVPTLLQVATPNKWSLYDCSTGEFIVPDDPSQAGWEEFQAYRDEVVRQAGDGDES